MNETELIYGKNAVIEVANFRRIHRVWATKATYKKIRNYLSIDRTSLSIVSKAEINDISGRTDHQGIVASADKYSFVGIDSLFYLSSGIILALDGITDPRNLGAIIRSSVLFGVDGIIIPRKNSSDITPVVCKASAGGTEHIAIARVESLMHTLNLFRERSFQIICADMPSEDSASIASFLPSNKLLVVMGSEDGLRKKVRTYSDIVVSIPQSSDFDSFNVSVAASIILWELTQKKASFKLAL
ncbi:23S rRNA (guanosine(2251)-2'-O)-methyltransferase RlmB [bacterium]|nr:23S rRNA (guanosine(2251)-2'-O)-methyltransferase RlmB [bacterium]